MIDDLWYKNSIIYSLDLDTFMDGNGDGVGDLPGLINRLHLFYALASEDARPLEHATLACMVDEFHEVDATSFPDGFITRRGFDARGV